MTQIGNVLIVILLLVMSMLVGVYIGISITEPPSPTYIVTDCPRQDPIAIYILSDGENVSCKPDNAVMTKTMEIWR